jgi:TRAP-type C4-dicarboxylate transport system substrate-binding protein
VFEAVDRHYQKLGLKLIAAPISHRTGYAFQLKTPVTAEGDLKGKKIRGTPTYHPLIRMLGGAPVVMSIGETYTALEKGVIDGGSGPVVGLLSFKWHEVGKNVTQPSFGVQHELFLMNLAAFNRLSDAEKTILLDEGRKIEEVWYTEYDRMAEAEYAELVKRGTTITTFGPSQQKLNEVWNDGLWGMAEQKSPADAKELRALARAKGLSN